MFLQTSEDIVRRFPQLENAVRFVDGVLEETSSSAILDPRQLARASKTDENQFESVLELLASAHQLIHIDAIECETCHVLIPKAIDTLVGGGAEQTYCTRCDRRVDTSNAITVYQYSAPTGEPRTTRVANESTVPPSFREIEISPMSVELTPEERRFLLNLFSAGALPDRQAIDNFIATSSLGVHLRIGLNPGNLETNYNSLIDVAHGRHRLGDLLLELSDKLGRDDIAVVASLYVEKYQNSQSESSRRSFFRVQKTTLEKLTSGKPFLEVRKLRTFLDLAERRICKVKCQGDENRGTGFLIGEDLVLTCFHVIERADSGEPHLVNNIEVEFDFLDRGTHPTTYKLISDWVIPFSKYSVQDLTEPPGDAEPDALDYAVLKLTKAAGKDVVDGRERGFFDISTHKMPSIGTPILIAGHPGPVDLQPLSFSMAAPGYEGLSPNGTRIIYKTSTEQGSSGSPVCDHNFNVIGLHHNRGTINAADVEHYDNNRGIPIQLIAADLSGIGIVALKKTRQVSLLEGT